MAERNFKKPQAENERVLARDANAVLLDNEEAEEVFVEGIGQFAIGPSITKLRFFRVLSSENKDGGSFERREISHVLIIPSSQLFEGLLRIIPLLKANIGQMEKHFSLSMETVRKLSNAQTDGVLK